MAADPAVEGVIFELFQGKLEHVGDAISGDDLYQSQFVLPDRFTAEEIYRGMQALIMKGYFVHTIEGYRNLFRITHEGLAVMRMYTTRPSSCI